MSDYDEIEAPDVVLIAGRVKWFDPARATAFPASERMRVPSYEPPNIGK